VIDQQRWYVAATQSKSEQLAEDHLKRQHFTVMLPWIIDPTGRRELRFPGYILVAFDRDTDRWRSINGTRGVKALLFGEYPTPLPRDAIAAIPAIETFGPFSPSARPFDTGDRVRVIDGPFEGHVGTIGLTGVERVQILLSLLSRTVKVYVSPHQIDHAA